MELYFQGFIPIFSGTLDMCPYIGCPIPAGENLVSVSDKIDIPEFVPTGLYTGRGTVVNENDEVLTCASFSFRIL